ncbi:hypothetical protein DYBT9275_00778 [Dyadobacter sp. CECT 9275]|uniref:PIN domain-containing protein n=2 Tax=Dyadobacter helix TaxID=2822344 RepID=A0A916J932_9BACT|nr:hypothetical protein DYBT9275_00778 [Dyadobacter sp. CECT 9275]
MVVAELRSLALQNKWGIIKRQELDIYLNEFVRIDKMTNEIVNRYAEIDAYSQGKLDTKPFADSARNMGKNDLWIAAITSVLNATLITTDKDFQHLHKHFLQVAYFDI